MQIVKWRQRQRNQPLSMGILHDSYSEHLGMVKLGYEYVR